MSSDLIAGLVALVLASAVVILGWRRNLSAITRNGMPRLDEGSERTAATLGLYEGHERRRRALSRRQRSWLVSFYLLMAFTYGAFAVMSADDRVRDASLAGLFALVAMLHLWQRPSHPPDGPAS
ncbi:MAG TPA: hypothetical protein VGB06_10310 [Solirubrobacterales bacterium]|jgi:hypothetical protein